MRLASRSEIHSDSADCGFEGVVAEPGDVEDGFPSHTVAERARHVQIHDGDASAPLRRRDLDVDTDDVNVADDGPRDLLQARCFDVQNRRRGAAGPVRRQRSFRTRNGSGWGGRVDKCR